jgi:NAD(P)H dehydrogenase (quinone)
MIAIVGATGKMGGAAAAELRRRGLAVRAVIRAMAKAQQLMELGCELVVADLTDARALTEALRGADGAFVILPPRPAAADVEADARSIVENLALSLEAARPKRVIAISDYGAERPSGTGITMLFHHLEARLGRLPLPLTFLRSAEHLQNQVRQLKAARERGALFSLHHPLTKQFPAVASQDVGLVAADLLAAKQGAPRVLHVEGPRRYSMLDVASAFSLLLGRPVVAKELAREKWIPTLEAAGVPQAYARLVAELQDAHNAGQIGVEPGGEVRRGATTLEAVLATLVRA